ncbi:hypothetical protein [Sphingomonas sp. 3-13AW]|uniref:hypothetical protein n=1 Tax=Sphingomonas sp. 3-13AW TaxID=3050450 RepID=UPI003BB69DEB
MRTDMVAFLGQMDGFCHPETRKDYPEMRSERPGICPDFDPRIPLRRQEKVRVRRKVFPPQHILRLGLRPALRSIAGCQAKEPKILFYRAAMQTRPPDP